MLCTGQDGHLYLDVYIYGHGIVAGMWWIIPEAQNIVSGFI